MNIEYWSFFKVLLDVLYLIHLNKWVYLFVCLTIEIHQELGQVERWFFLLQEVGYAWELSTEKKCNYFNVGKTLCICVTGTSSLSIIQNVAIKHKIVKWSHEPKRLERWCFLHEVMLENGQQKEIELSFTPPISLDWPVSLLPLSLLLFELIFEQL